MKTIQTTLIQFTSLPPKTKFKGAGVFEMALEDHEDFPVKEKLYEALNGKQVYKKTGYTKK